jgi:hypothetical protein
MATDPPPAPLTDQSVALELARAELQAARLGRHHLSGMMPAARLDQLLSYQVEALTPAVGTAAAQPKQE